MSRPNAADMPGSGENAWASSADWVKLVMRTSPFAAAGNLSEVTEMMLDREIRLDEIVRRALVVACELVRVWHTQS